MKNVHPLIAATTSSPTSPSSPSDVSDPVIRLKLDKPLHWDWELTTSADTLPVVQLLDKDGRLLVETTGRTAQRARGSFRDGLKSYEKFLAVVEASKVKSDLQLSLGNRNVDGFSSKFGYVPIKSRSEANVSFSKDRKDKRIKKRHSSGVETTLERSKEESGKERRIVKRYSAGDYLRQQIVDDLLSNRTVGRTPEQIASDRCNKVKAHLRSQSDLSSSVGFHDEKLKELKDYSQESNREGDSSKGGSRRNEELERIKEYLKEKIKEKMAKEKLQSSRSQTSMCDSDFGCKASEVRKRYSEQFQIDRRKYRTRKVRSEANIEFGPKVYERDRIKLVKPRNFVAREDSQRNKPYRRCRSDVIAKMPELAEGQKTKTKNSTGSDRRKVYRKTKSDLLLGQMGTSVDSEKDYRDNSPRRIRSQDNVERSWREYKERRKQERLYKESENAVAEEDFMSKPRWKDFQGLSCDVKNCKVCQNTKNCTDPFEVTVENTGQGSVQRNCERIVKTNCSVDSNPTDFTDNDIKRPGTTLQENYLVLEPMLKSNATRSPVISKIQVNVERDGNDVTSKLDSPDFGYNSIQKNSFEEYKELYANSNVKKSDTFKIVDGSEDVNGILEKVPADPSNESTHGDAVFNDSKRFDGNEPLTPQSNEDITRDYFKRVYELLKQRQEDTRRMAEGCVPAGYEDTSSSNCPEQVQKRRRRRRKKDNALQGDEVVAVGPTSGRRGSWTIERFFTNDDPANQQRLRRSQQQQDVAGAKRLRHPPVPALSTCKANARDISKYFGSPNKENSPEYDVNVQRPKENAGIDTNEEKMGSNLSRHNGKGLTGRRTQSSGNLCDPKGKLNNVGKILVPCSSTQRDRYKFCGSLPNHLDGKDVLEDDPGENNNVLPDTIAGNLGGTLPHKKRSLGVHFSDSGPTGTLDLVKHRSQDSLDDNPWRYQQSSDLDLVRCKHGNFDLVRRNQGAQDTVDGDFGKKYVRGVTLDERCHRSSDLDLVPGALAKRRQDSRNDGQNVDTCVRQKYTVDNVDEDLMMKLVHKPDCELMKHRQLNRGVDLKLSKLTGGEPQDQGYASERSPEDEHPPSLPGQPFPSVTTESTFRVTLQKSSRGLGLSVSGGGTAGPVRVKRLFPQQPAALSNKLQPGDILLAANGIPLTGLTNYEALEVLRTTPSTVELVVCRPPGDATITPPGAPPPPPARREPPPPLRILNPLPPLQIEPCGEFDIEMTKVGGSLGFTLRKADSSALGHYVRALVREPALSDGRIQPGDKIVAVDGAALSPMSHEEAVALLRQCGPRVRLRLYRDLAQTPVSALSPTEPDHPLRPPRTSLRQEAVDMLCDLAVRKLSPGTSSGSSCRQSSGLSCGSPRRLRRPPGRTPTSENEQGNPQKYYVTQTSTTSQVDTSDSDQCSIKTQITNSQSNTPVTDIIDPPALYDVYDSSDSKPSRPSFLDLTASQDKPHFQFSLDSDSDYTGPIIVTESDSNLATECDYDELTRNVPTTMSSDDQDNDLPSEPASMPPILLSNDNVSTAFSYKNPAYQSANPSCTVSESNIKSKATHSSDQDIPGKVLGADDQGGSKGLLKWKGVMFTPNDSTEEIDKLKSFGSKNTPVPVLTSAREQDSQMFMVELTRGWNSRLGFSLQPEGNRTVISAVHADSVAAKDGRLKQGDVLMMINDESVEHMPTAEIIDLLRKIRGSIGITVMRRNKQDSTT